MSKKKKKDIAANIAELLDLVKTLVELQTVYVKQKIDEYEIWKDADCEYDECVDDTVTSTDEDEPSFSDDFEEVIW